MAKTAEENTVSIKESEFYKKWQNRFVKTAVSILPAITVCGIIYNIFNNYATGFNVFQMIVCVFIIFLLFIPFTFFDDYINIFRRILGDNIIALLFAGIISGVICCAGCGLATWIPEKAMYNKVDYEFIQHYEDCGVTFDAETGSIRIDSDVAGSYEEALKIEENLKSDILVIDNMRPTFFKKFIKPLPLMLVISVILVFIMTSFSDKMTFSNK